LLLVELAPHVVPHLGVLRLVPPYEALFVPPCYDAIGNAVLREQAEHEAALLPGSPRPLTPEAFTSGLAAALSAIEGLDADGDGASNLDEILAGTGSFPGTDGANGTYHLMMVMLILAAFCTAAYMTRTIWYAFFGEFRGHGHPHESGPRITVPLIILATLGAVAGLANLPKSLQIVEIPGSWSTRFEKFVEPVGLYFPQIQHAGFNLGLALVSVVVGLSGIVLSYLYFWKGSFRWAQGLSGRNKLAGTGKRVLENKYYFDWLYTDVITGFVKGPLANATNWFNQHVVDGVVNGVGRGAVVRQPGDCAGTDGGDGAGVKREREQMK
jgi:NADH-quinone oxidoreductase subunit L